MRIITLAVAITTMALTGCRDDAPASAASQTAPVGGTETGPPAPFDSSLPMPELMAHVMQHAGEGVWRWQGSVLDKQGEHSLFPKNDEEWEEAESGALTLAEATNLLLLPGRRVDEAQWDVAVTRVRKVARAAALAAEKHDKAGLLAAGSALDEACDSCHERFDPSFRQPRP